MTRIAVIGSGNVGGGLGTRLSNSGFEVKFGVRDVDDKVKALLAKTKGATASTPGWVEVRCRTSRQSGRPAPNAVSVACDVMLRMRVRSSRSKPFMTDSTTISVATPIATPTIEIAEMKDRNRLPVERR